MIYIVIFIYSLLIDEPTWQTSLPKAQLEASQSGKYILLNFAGSDWCIPCKRLEKEVFEDPNFIEFAKDNLILVKADFPRQKKNQLSESMTRQNEKLAEKYNPDGIFPYTLILDAAGHRVASVEGMPKGSTIDFIEKLDNILHPDKK